LLGGHLSRHEWLLPHPLLPLAHRQQAVEPARLCASCALWGRPSEAEATPAPSLSTTGRHRHPDRRIKLSESFLRLLVRPAPAGHLHLCVLQRVLHTSRALLMDSSLPRSRHHHPRLPRYLHCPLGQVHDRRLPLGADDGVHLARHVSCRARQPRAPRIRLRAQLQGDGPQLPAWQRRTVRPF
jgi:hypothetical protein